jgi:gas vesicle protein GvpL/GvpF
MSHPQTAQVDRQATPGGCRCQSASAATRPAHRAVWVYAVTASLDPTQLAGLTGVGGQPVRVVRMAELAAVVSSVDTAVFGEQQLRHLLGDVSNIELIGREHNQVVESVAAEGPVVPLRLATIYPDDVTIRALLAERYGELAGLLRSFRGAQEWGVRVYVQPWGDTAASPATDVTDLPVWEPRWQQAEACAENIDRELTGLAITAKRHSAPDPRYGDVEGWMVLNAVYLLSSERAAEFGETVQQLADEHATLRADVTGPWAPYSFADPEA